VKKVIGGKLFDTEKATLIAEFWNGLYSSDAYSIIEELYVTDKGNYFIYGKGGPLSKYGVNCGNSMGGSSDIFSLS